MNATRRATKIRRGILDRPAVLYGEERLKRLRACVERRVAKGGDAPVG